MKSVFTFSVGNDCAVADNITRRNNPAIKDFLCLAGFSFGNIFCVYPLLKYNRKRWICIKARTQSAQRFRKAQGITFASLAVLCALCVPAFLPEIYLAGIKKAKLTTASLLNAFIILFLTCLLSSPDPSVPSISIPAVHPSLNRLHCCRRSIHPVSV
jgi:hypothetical protein